MKPMNSSKLLTAACALSLAMGIAGTAHAKHEGVAHGKKDKSPQLSIDVETFCGDPLMVPALDENGEVIYEDGNIVYDVIPGDENVAVRVTDVSGDFDDGSVPGAPELDIYVVCHERGPGKKQDTNPNSPGMTVFDEGVPLPSTLFDDVYVFECDVPAGATEWKATAIVDFDKDGDGELERKFDSCAEVLEQ